MEHLNETSKRQKAEGLFKFKYGNIKNFCIISPENPNGMQNDIQSNKTLVNKLRLYLKSEDFQYFPVKGVYNDMQENSFMIYNISLKECKFIAREFEQESFIFSDILDNKLLFTYYNTNGSATNPDFRPIETVEGYVNIEDGNCTAIGRNFKFNIPFKLFSSQNESIENKVERRKSCVLEYKEKCDKILNESVSDNSTFKHLRICRAMLYGENYYKFFMDE